MYLQWIILGSENLCFFLYPVKFTIKGPHGMQTIFRNKKNNLICKNSNIIKNAWNKCLIKIFRFPTP